MSNINPPLGFRIQELAKLFRNKVRDDVTSEGINISYVFILMYLEHHSNVTQKDLCDHMHMAAPTISLTLQSMERDGLLIREKSSEDSRKTFVSLTDLGDEMNEKVKGIIDKSEQKMLCALSSDELDSFLMIIDKLKGVLIDD